MRVEGGKVSGNRKMFVFLCQVLPIVHYSCDVEILLKEPRSHVVFGVIQ